MIRKSRKAQITVFIIIGIVVLFTAAVAIYISMGRRAPEREGLVVPAEIKPVYDFITACMHEIGSEAVDLAGLQGGFVNLDPLDPNTAFTARTPSAFINIDPGGLIRLPFWFYEGESRIPTESFIQKQISDYVAKNMQACINSFASFEPQFEIQEAGQMSVETQFTEADVVLRMSWPLEITGASGVTSQGEYLAFVPVRLKRVRDLAEDIMEAENKKMFFENLTIEFISMSQDIPMDGLLFECGVKTWKLEDIRKKLQSILKLNLMRVKVKGTDHVPFQAKESVYEALARDYPPAKLAQGIFPPAGSPTDAYEHAMMYLDAGAENAEDLKVHFTYDPAWGMDITASPSRAGLLRSNAQKGFQRFISFLCMNVYHFTYDIRYPVKAMIRDPESNEGVGYTFQFAFPVYVVQNEAKREQFRTRAFDDMFFDPAYCENLGSQVIDVMAMGYDEQGYAMPSGLKGVNVSFVCMNRYCNVGQTGYNPAIPGKYLLRTVVPAACANPFVTLEKEGYLPVSVQINSQTTLLRADMKKLNEMELRVVKHPYFEASQDLGPAQELAEYDTVSMFIRMKNSTFEQTILYPDVKEISLLDGTATYEIDAFLNRRDSITGGYSSYNTTISVSQISGKDTMVLHTFEYRPIPTSDEQVTQMFLYMMEGTYLGQLAPTFE